MLKKIASLFKQQHHVEYIDEQGNANTYPTSPKTSLLDTLLDNGQNAPYSCCAGVCQCCMMKCDTPDQLPVRSQQGLSAAEVELGYFLPCICHPSNSLKVSSIAKPNTLNSSTVIEKNWLSASVIQLRLESNMSFKSGQFCNLLKSEHVGRAYSIASTPSDPYLEFHIKHVEDGQLSNWIAHELEAGQEIGIQGPYGECIYIESNNFKEKPMLLSGIGTGLAPLLSILKTAVSQKHTAPIDLVLGAKHADNFYLQDTLREIEQNLPSVNIHWIIKEASAPGDDIDTYAIGDIYDYIETTFKDLSAHHIYLCGAPSFVHKMKKACMSSQAAIGSIYSDIFHPGS